ncbi:MAG: RCC1 domain-containing protein [Polyangiaceae bacterium]
MFCNVHAAARLAVGPAYRYACAPGGDGGVGCWGRNTHGQLGRGSTDNDTHPLPEPVPGLADVIRLATGKTHACAIVRGGTLRCWGENSPACTPGRRPAQPLAARHGASSAISSAGRASAGDARGFGL